MDWTSITPDQWSYLAVVWLGMVVGKVQGMETRVLTGLLLVALLAPGNFAVVGLAVIVGAFSVKVMLQFLHWGG